jgi:hypothetical protein
MTSWRALTVAVETFLMCSWWFARGACGQAYHRADGGAGRQDRTRSDYDRPYTMLLGWSNGNS